MRLSAFGWVLVWAVLATGVAAVCGWKWASASARCDARLAESREKAAEDGALRYAAGVTTATEIANVFRGETSQAIADAAEATGERGVRIVRVPTSGGCVMPVGLPTLAPAAQEARDAAR